MEIRNIFATPIWQQANLEFFLEDFILEMEKKGDVQRYTNVAGYQSKKDFHKLPELKNLIDWCESSFGYKCLNAWANINKNGSYHRRHVHPGCRVSCVYYVKGGSPIRFFDPRHISYMLDATQVVEITPQDNMLLAFPAWLEHEVAPHESKEPRISIAVNLG